MAASAGGPAAHSAVAASDTPVPAVAARNANDDFTPEHAQESRCHCEGPRTRDSKPAEMLWQPPQ